MLYSLPEIFQMATDTTYWPHMLEKHCLGFGNAISIHSPKVNCAVAGRHRLRTSDKQSFCILAGNHCMEKGLATTGTAPQKALPGFLRLSPPLCSKQKSNFGVILNFLGAAQELRQGQVPLTVTIDVCLSCSLRPSA